ncbi:MAG TPA: hypothetical protein VFL91_05130 [Thermomicrobiales bacterium]|nr:hypothetical protein [Thermomicrobiales bacterium]
MTIEAGALLLELAAEHLLPALVTEAAGYALRHALRSGVPIAPQPPRPPARPRVVALAAPAGVVAILSDLPGRVRLAVPGLRGDPARAAAALAAVGAEPGVLAARASALTGTLLIRYDPARVAVGRLCALAGRAA